MIDKLEVRVPAGTAFTPDAESMFIAINGRPNRHYLRTCDFRGCGYSSILHFSCLHGKRPTNGQLGARGNHKLELVDTGLMTYEDMLAEIEYVFHVRAETLSIMRLDLAVDVEGIGVPWFAENTRVLRKQWIGKLGIIETAEMGKKEPQTLYYGRRPNVIRIYNKVEECRMQHRQLQREIGPNLPVPSFEEYFGFPETGKIITRVERQIGGGRVPSNLASVGQLTACPDFNPFDAIHFVAGGCPEPDPANHTFMEYCTGMYLRQMVQTQGMQATLAFITRVSNRNRGWAMDKFRDFLPPKSKNGFNESRLFQLFRESTRAQLKGLDSACKSVEPG